VNSDDFDLDKLIAPPEEEAPDGSGRKTVLVRTRPLRYVPRFPLAVLRHVRAANADRALPLVLAMHRRFHMGSKRATPLTGDLWGNIGNPSENERHTILQNLRKMPELVEIKKSRRLLYAYELAKGPLWDTLMTQGDGQEGVDGAGD
jgi:hypothetical protein